MTLYQGGCLCGKVRFEITGDITDIIYCHCSRCRKAQGSAFATNGNVHKDNFRFISGEALLTAYKSSAKERKYFCSKCGSPIMSKKDSVPSNVRIRLGTIETPITQRPFAQTFVGSKAN